MTPKPQPKWAVVAENGQAQINFPPTYKFDKYSAQGSVRHFCKVCETMPRMWQNSVPSEMLPVALGVVSKNILSSKSCKSSSSMKQYLVRTIIPLWGFLIKFQTCNRCKMLQFATLVPLKPKWFSLGFPHSSPGCFALLACGRKFMIPPRSKGFPVGRSRCPVMGVDKSIGGHFFFGTSFSYSFFFISETWWSSQKISWSCCFVFRFASHVFFGGLETWQNLETKVGTSLKKRRQQKKGTAGWCKKKIPRKQVEIHYEMIIPHQIPQFGRKLTW